MNPLAAGLARTLSKLERPKRDTVITTLLLLGTSDPKLQRECLDNLRQGSAGIDEELVLRLYSASDDKAKRVIARSFVVGRMQPGAFRKIFDPVYARSDLTRQERRELMWTLGLFLGLNPSQGPAYERIVLELARSRHLDLNVGGIPMAAQFARIDAAMLTLFARRLKSRSPIQRLTAVNAFSHLADRLDQLGPHVRDLLASDAFRKNMARLHRADPDVDVRTGAWHLLRRLRRHLGPRKRRVPSSARRA